MMTYDEAVETAMAGKAVCVSLAGGYKRYAHFSVGIGRKVFVKLFDTIILAFHPNGQVTLNTGGYRTATTKGAMNALLPNGRIWTDRKLGLCYFPSTDRANPIPFHDGMTV
jgi:hypothetical protein